MQHQPTNWITTLIPFVIIAGVLAFRIRTMSRERPLNLATLWIIPAVYVLVAGSLVFAAPPSQLGWGLMAVGLAIGLGLGWYRGRLIHIHRDAETGKLRQ
jgi:cytochrome bd-type quinol oxidase subunit 2